MLGNEKRNVGKTAQERGNYFNMKERNEERRRAITIGQRSKRDGKTIRKKERR
jgi:hypothetical protein